MRMKKALGIFICASLVLGLMPGTNMTAEATPSGDAITTNSLPMIAGEYYLDGDVTINSTWSAPSGITTIDLNGHGIMMKGSGSVITVGKNGSTLIIKDSGINTTNRITLNGYRGESVNADNPGTVTNGSGTVAISGGYITGGSVVNGNGGGVYVDGGTCQMMAGTIIGNKITRTDSGWEHGHGAAVCVTGGGTFEMTGGMITGNGGVNSKDNDGLVYGAVTFVQNSKGIFSGDAKVVKNGCDGVYVDKKDGSADLTISGGRISENAKAGVVFAGGDDKFKLSGNVAICDNEAMDIRVAGGKITIPGELTNTERISVSMDTIGVFTNSTNTNYNIASKFTSDNTNYAVGKNADGQLYIDTDPAVVTYKIVNGTWSDGTTDKTEVVAKGSTLSDIPTGMKPAAGYTTGKWDKDPAEAAITEDTVFTYTMAKQQPSSGSTSSSSSSSSSSGTKPTTSVNSVSTTASGSTSGATVTDKNGNAIESALVTVSYKDSSGNVVTKEVLTDEKGKIASNEVITVKQTVSANGKTTTENKSFLANPDGTVYDTPGFADVEVCVELDRSDVGDSAKVVYVNEDGSLKQSEKFTVTTKTGKKVRYAVGDDCNIIMNGFFNAKKTSQTGKTIKKGASYFAGSNGKILTNTLFTVKTTKKGKVKVKINQKGSKLGSSTIIMDEELAYEIFDYKKGGLESASGKGEQYYATKSGKIAKGKWVNVGLKEYYCGSNGAVKKSR